MGPLHRAVVVFGLLAGACGGEGTAPAAAEDDGALLGGAAALPRDLRSVVRINEDCTATQIARRLLLTASHCVRLPSGAVAGSFAPGALMTIEARDDAGKLAMHRIKIDYAKVHPRVAEVCAQENGGAGCKGPSARALRDAPDVAIVKLAADIPGASVSPISTMPPRPGDIVHFAGFGCHDAIGRGYDDVLRRGTAPVIDAAAAATLGRWPAAAASTDLGNVYFYSEGPAARAGSGAAGLCPGDSGGPAFRLDAEGPAIVGVHSSYVFAPGRDDAPAVNWDSRLDVFARHGVFVWLEREGAKFTR